jgi:hypothetical protein
MDKEGSEFDNLKYMHGFGNAFETEAKEGVIPQSKICCYFRPKQSCNSERWPVCRTTIRDSFHNEKIGEPKGLVL